MSGIFLTEELRDGIAYYGVWRGAGGNPRSGSFDVGNKLLCLCPYEYNEALETATALAEWHEVVLQDLTK
jgi:hypothetical protein